MKGRSKHTGQESNKVTKKRVQTKGEKDEKQEGRKEAC